MTKKKAFLMWVVALTGMLQMPSMGASAAVRTMVEVFGKELVEVQTSMASSGIVLPIVSIIIAILIRKEIVSKRTVVIFGLGLLSFTGFLSIFIHQWFWSIRLMAILQGIASGCYVSTAISLVIDDYTVDERRKINGMHSVFVGLGGILLCLIGGLLVNLLWYAGYLLFLLSLPLFILSFFAIPKKPKSKKTEENGEKKKRSKINPDIFYYVALVLLFMIIYNSSASNISTHFKNNGIGDYAKFAGFATATQMAGTMIMSFFFNKLSKRFGDMIISFAFAFIFVGFTIINLFSKSIVMMFIGIFIMGLSMPCLGPQAILAISKRVDDSTSAIGTSLANGIAPGLGTFLSPVIITNITEAISPNNTNFRYQFAGCLALAMAVFVFIMSKVREKKHGM